MPRSTTQIQQTRLVVRLLQLRLKLPRLWWLALVKAAAHWTVSGLPLEVDFLAQPGLADGDASYRLRALKPGLVQ